MLLPNKKIRLLRKARVILYSLDLFIKAHLPVKRTSPLETVWSFFTCLLACICLIFIAGTSNKGVQGMISPIVSSVQSSLTTLKILEPRKITLNTFSYIPGSAPNKFTGIDFQGLNMIAFYDVPMNPDGSLIMDSDGYQVFHSDDTTNLIQTAHAHGTKVLLTLSQTYNPDILALLDNPQAQQTLYQQTAQEVSTTGIDGVAIDVEYTGQAAAAYQDKYTAFVKGFTDYMHGAVPNSLVTVALADKIDNSSIYNTKALTSSADKTLIMAYSFAVPENTNASLASPVFGFDSNEYLKALNQTETQFADTLPTNKLVMERAWYGNGNNYPLYNTDDVSQDAQGAAQNTLNAPLSNDTVERLIADVPDGAQDAARRNLPYITQALKDEGILNANVLAYALATIQHETADTFEPIDEYTGRKNARRLGYEGGTDYYGRGFIQLTHLRNYQKMGRRIGMGDELVKHPELASQPTVAAKVLAAYFKDFGIAKTVTEGNFVDARTLINPDYNGYMIAQVALSFLYALG